MKPTRFGIFPFFIAIFTVITLIGANPASKAAQTAPEAAPSAVLFADDFNDGDADGWTHAGLGSWRVENGYLVIDMGTGYAMEGEMWAGDPSWVDYQLDVDVYGAAGVDKMVRVRRSEGQFTYVDLRSGANGWGSDVGISFSPLSNDWQFVEAANPINHWDHLTVSVVGSRARVSVNGTPKLDVQIPNGMMAAGNIALVGWSGGAGRDTTYFDNVVVTSLGHSISGYARTAGGAGIEGVRVQTQLGSSTLTAADGSYVLNDLDTKLYQVSASKAGYTLTPAWNEVDLVGSVSGVNFTGNPGDPPPVDPPAPRTDIPVVTGIEPCIKGPYYFNSLVGIIQNRYTTTVNWNGLPPRYVVFGLNENSDEDGFILYTSGSEASILYNIGLGSPFKYNPFDARNTFTSVAHSADGKISVPYHLTQVGIFFPVWIPAQSAKITVPMGCGSPMKVEAGYAIPVKPWKGEFSMPEFIPIFGGESFGLRETQATFGVYMDGSGVLGGKVTGQTGFRSAGSVIVGKITGKGDGLVSPDTGPTINKASLGIEVKGVIRKVQPVITLICKAVTAGTCPLKQIENTPFVGEIVKWLNQRLKVEGKVEPTIGLDLNFKSQNSQLAFEDVTLGAKVRLTLTLILDAIKDMVTAEAYGGGEPAIKVHIPANPSFLKELSADIFAGLKLKVWAFERRVEATYRLAYAPQAGATTSALDDENAVLTSMHDSGWKPETRDFLKPGVPYAAFTANDNPLQMGVSLQALQKANGALTTQENLIATNVYPEGKPVIAVDGAVLLAWVTDDLNKPVLQAKEIVTSRYWGGAWSTPVQITHDNLQDFAPQAAVDVNDHVVVVWERSRTVQPDDPNATLDAQYANSFEIAYSVFDGTSWSSPAFLMNNAYLDHAPLLARGNDGILLLVWRQNPQGELVGTPAAPDTFYFATWDGSTWSAPAVLMKNAVGVLGTAAARKSATTMMFAYVEDTDADITTSADQEIYQTAFNGGKWGLRLRLTDDAQPDNTPTLFYHPVTGVPRLLWMKGSTLYAMLDGIGSVPEPVVVDGGPAMIGYTAAQGHDGQLALLWQGISGEGVDIFYATYDAGHGVFSLEEQLTHDQPLEKFMAAAFAPTNELLLSYNKTAFQTETVNTGMGPVDGVTTYGQTDLYVLRHSFGADLSLPRGSAKAGAINAGSTQITATLWNLGDEPVDHPEVSFYLGDPAAGGQLITILTADTLLYGGATTNLSFTYPLPAGSGPFYIYVVADGANKVPETNESNNQTVLVILAPDLVATDLEATYPAANTVRISGAVKNIGDAPSTAGKATLRRDDPLSGTLIGQVDLPALLPGESTPVEMSFAVAGLPDGRVKVYAIPDEEGLITEQDEDNAFWTWAALLPDLELRADAVTTSRTGTNTVTASAWVYNTGLRDAQNVSVGAFIDQPKAGEWPFVSTTIDLIPAGESRLATLDLGSNSLKGIYLSAGYNAEDANPANNSLPVVLPPDLPPGPQPTQEIKPVLSGAVVDQAGQPVPGAMILIEETGENVTTGDDGHFSMEPEIKTFYLSASKEGYDIDKVWVENFGSSTPPVQFAANHRVLFTGGAQVVTTEGVPAAVNTSALNADDDNSPGELVYTLTNLPQNGILTLDGVTMDLEGHRAFTQADVIAGKVLYLHDGGDTVTDGFTFDLNDGAGSGIDGHRLTISILPANDAPVLDANAGLDARFGSLGYLTDHWLHAADSDTPARQRVFTVTIAPAHGYLYKQGALLTAGSQFTQEDINLGRIVYQPVAAGSTADSFTFTVSDGAAAPLGPEVFTINLLPQLKVLYLPVMNK